MKKNKLNIISISLLILFVIGVSCTTAKGPKKCNGKRGQKTNMGTI